MFADSASVLEWRRFIFSNICFRKVTDIETCLGYAFKFNVKVCFGEAEALSRIYLIPCLLFYLKLDLG